MYLNLLNNRNKLSDAELVERFRRSDDQQFLAVLFQRYSELIAAIALKYLNKSDAEDAIMEVYEIIQTDLKLYEIQKFSNWLYSVVRNHCLKKKKVQQVYVKTDMEEHHLKALVYSGVEYNEEKDQMLLSIGGALSGLKEDQRKCLELFYWEQKSYKEIEEILEMDIKKVKSNIQNGKRNIKNVIEI